MSQHDQGTNTPASGSNTGNQAVDSAVNAAQTSQVGGVTRTVIRLGAPAENPANSVPHFTGTPLDADNTNGPRIGHADGTPKGNYQSFSTADLPVTSSFRDALGRQCSPKDAKTVVCGNGLTTSVEAAVHLGLVEMTNDGPRATGKILRGGQLMEGREAAAYLAAERLGNQWNDRVAERKALAAAYGDEAAQDWWQRSGGSEQEARMRQFTDQLAQALSGTPAAYDPSKPALTPIPEAEWNAMQQAKAQAAQQAKAQAEQERTQGIADHIDADLPQLRAIEVTQTAGIKSDAVSFLRHALAQAVVTGDQQGVDRAVGVFAQETGVTAQRANEIAATVGRQLGAPIKVLAERAGVAPQALMQAMQQADPVAFSEALVAVASSRNASALLRLAVRTINAHRSGAR